jgi:ubiquinone/menaquinone biosynthesis C-methylase UbiE
VFTLRNLIPAPLRPLARRGKRALRAAVGVRTDAPLSDADSAAAVTAPNPVVVAVTDDPLTVTVRLTNHGSRVWSGAGTCPVGLAARFRTPRQQPVPGAADAVIPLPVLVYPGEPADVPLAVRVPKAPGQYLLEVSLTQAGNRTLSRSVARFDVRAAARPEEDINYRAVYAVADLAADYWSVTGPSSKDEYDRLAAVKRKLLVQHGLTPDSRLLDVGCGTGQVAQALEPFLSDRGLFVGTDVGAEAIDFCRRRFTRPNFRFLVNEPTTLAMDDSGFDAACLFSVFTHTFPDETTLLLAELNRLLKPGGWVLADFFASAVVEGFAGNRGAVEVNREHLLRLAAVAGFRTAEKVQEYPRPTGANREFYKFTRG